MADIYAIIGIVMLIFGILQIVLFFKLWGMTNDVRRLTEHFLKSDENENINLPFKEKDGSGDLIVGIVITLIGILIIAILFFYSLINLHSHIPSSPVVTE